MSTATRSAMGEATHGTVTGGAAGEATYARLRVIDPGRWRAAAVAWREAAARVGRSSAESGPHAARLRAAWSGPAASAAATRLDDLRRQLVLTRLGCWAADQVLSEAAAALGRARALLGAAVDAAQRAGLVVDVTGRVGAPGPLDAGRAAVARGSAAGISTALALADRADAVAARRLTEIAATGAPERFAPVWRTPPCGATPAEVRRWWDGLTPAERRGLVAAEPAVVGALDGVPVAVRDQANRLLLDDRLAELGGDPRDGRLRAGLYALADRLSSDADPRAYLLRLDLSGEGRAVVALGDPDGADNVVTHVPGMTADLASFGGELERAARVADRAQQLAPSEATSAVLWLDYDAPDGLLEAAGASRAEAGAQGLHRFQDGLRASHEGPPAHQTVSGHSYGSLVVGAAAARTGFAADSVVFVGSPGVGVDSVAGLRVPAAQVWSTTSATDVIQYAAVAPAGLVPDLAVASALPGIGPVWAFGRPEDDLWHGHNPSDPGFGARVFAAQPDAGHLGYWDPGRPALESLALIALGGAFQDRVG